MIMPAEISFLEPSTYLEGLKDRIAAVPRPVECAVCGRDLSDVKSVENGIGPICRGKQRAAAGIMTPTEPELFPEEVERTIGDVI